MQRRAEEAARTGRKFVALPPRRPKGWTAPINGDLMKTGVIVPTKVERTAAASIAALLLTTDAVISEIKEEKPEPAGASGSGMY